MRPNARARGARKVAGLRADMCDVDVIAFLSEQPKKRARRPPSIIRPRVIQPTNHRARTEDGSCPTHGPSRDPWWTCLWKCALVASTAAHERGANVHSTHWRKGDATRQSKLCRLSCVSYRSSMATHIACTATTIRIWQRIYNCSRNKSGRRLWGEIQGRA